MTATIRLAAILWGATSLLGISGMAAAQSSPNTPDNGGVEVTHYQNWAVRCDQSTGVKQCEMTQVVNGPNSDTPIMRVIMGNPPQIDVPAMVFVLPLGTQLARGLRISVDGGQPLRIPFRVCLDSGCRASMPIKSSLLSELKLGGNIKVAIIGPQGEHIDLNVSLMGFTAAAKAITPQ